MTNERRILKESEELLLMKFVDDECGILERSRALKLIETSPEAVDFVDVMRSSKADLKDAAARETRSVDLWERVQRRITAEERAELFLGKRVAVAADSEPGFFARLLGSWAGWGVSGAFVTAGLAFFMLWTPGQQSQPADQVARVLAAPSSESEGFTPVARRERPRIINDDVPSAVEVDWMRSDGRVRILPGPSERSTIIWVRRPEVAPRSKRESNRPVIIERATPVALSASQR
jgi:hypothetical protein